MLGAPDNANCMCLNTYNLKGVINAVFMISESRIGIWKYPVGKANVDMKAIYSIL